MEHEIKILSGCDKNETYRILYIQLDDRIIVLSYSYEDNDESEFGGVTSFVSSKLKVELSNISYVENSNIWGEYWHENLV